MVDTPYGRRGGTRYRAAPATIPAPAATSRTRLPGRARSTTWPAATANQWPIASDSEPQHGVAVDETDCRVAGFANVEVAHPMHTRNS